MNRRSTWTIITALLLLVACSDVPNLDPLESAPATAAAVQGPDLFELDGNSVDDARAGIDASTVWDRVVNGAPLPPSERGIEITATAFATDSESGADDSVFTGAGSRDHRDIPDWNWTFERDPLDRNDLLHGGAAALSDRINGDTFLYFFADREGIEEGHFGVWFLRQRVANIGLGDPGGSDPFAGSHATGDVLVLSDFPGDGSVSSVRVYRWLEPDDRSRDAGEPDLNSPHRLQHPELDLLFVGTDCGAMSVADVACATVAAADDTAAPPWNSGAPYETGRYLEGGLELSRDLGIGPVCFSTVLFETRSSPEVSAVLEDFVVAPLDLCDASITVTPSDTAEVGGEHTFDVAVEPTTANRVTVASVTIDAAVSPTPDTSTTTCSAPVLARGIYRCSLTIDSLVTGRFTANARTVVTFSDGTVITRDTALPDAAAGGISNTGGLPGSGPGGSGPGGSGPRGSGPAVKTYVDAGIDIESSAAGEVGVPVIVKVRATVDDGGGFIAAPDDTTIDFAIVDGPGVLSEVRCLTKNGVCSVELVSDETGTTTLSAAASIEVGGVSLPRSTADDAAVTTFVDAYITVDGVDSGEQDDRHAFIITVREDAGAGFVAAAGETVEVIFVVANGADAPASASCRTDASGSCTVTLDGVDPGRIDAVARSQVGVGGISVLRSTDGSITPSGARNSDVAAETTVTAGIRIESDGGNDVGDAHVFTVTVVTDDGSGPEPATVGHVDVSLSDENGAFSIVDAAAGTCDDEGDNLDESGRCTLVFTSAGTGRVTGHARIVLDLDGVLVPLETDGLGSNSGPAVQTLADAVITIAADGVHEVGDPHSFRIVFRFDDGSGTDTDGEPGTLDRRPGAEVTVTLADMNGAGNAPSTPVTGVTDENGEFEVTFTSATAGMVTGSAAAGYPLDGVTLARSTDGAAPNSGVARATFVDAAITIAPNGVGSVGEDPTFTATVWVDDGGGADTDGEMGTFDRVGPEVPVRVALTNGDGATNVPAGRLTRVTDDAGAFALKFTSATAGTVTGHASTTVTVAGLALARETDGSASNSGDALQVFVAGSLTLFMTDVLGDPLCCATFEIERAVDRFGVGIIGPFIGVTDNTPPDANPAPGAIEIDGLPLGGYEVREIAAPTNFLFDDGVLKTATLTIDDPHALLSDPFVNRPIGGGCPAEFWQGEGGADLWDSADDPDFDPGGGNPYTHDTLFNAVFMDMDELDDLTMLDLAASTDGQSAVRNAARSLVTAYLNASHGRVMYALGTVELKQLWNRAVLAPQDAGTDVFAELNTLLNENNSLGCDVR